ncbi:hypothetical protein J1605_007093 [Eschrichtius robustus]|uniref:Uncharacterized protein n=1 Tax=Eschrichtius robustus TaxID=9764 RepID=A0AB34H345_ESCRO|nr:hypothetical protein J1605_007093 [Eschrichtius robustus]
MPLASTWSLEVPAGHAKEAGAGREGQTAPAQARRTAGSRHKGACPQGAAATQPGFHGLWAVRDQSRSSPFARQAGNLELHVKFPNSRRLAQSVMRYVVISIDFRVIDIVEVTRSTPSPLENLQKRRTGWARLGLIRDDSVVEPRPEPGRGSRFWSRLLSYY